MWLGKPTGSAMPLMWAHAEYVKLLRSAADGKVYDSIPEVAARYLGKRSKRKELALWKPNRHARFMQANEVLRVLGNAAFTLHWSIDDWKTVHDSGSTQNSLQINYVDLNDVVLATGTSIRFTFLWTESQHWEGRDYLITVKSNDK